MIRTAILAGLLLVMVSIAYSHWDTRVDERTMDTTKFINEPPPVKAIAPSAKAGTRRAPAPVLHEPQARPVPVENEEKPVQVSVPTRDAALTPAVVKTPAPSQMPAEPVVEQKEPAPAIAAAPHAPTSLLIAPEAKTAAVEPSAPAAVAQETRPVPKAKDLPVVNVAARPAMEPWDAPAGTAHNSGPATVAGKPTEEAPKFMSPQERSRELYRLAQEMEDLFIVKLTH